MKLNTSMLAAGLLMTSLTTSFTTMALGQTGHRVVGQICQNHLSVKAWSEVSNILGGEQLAYASTWPDEMRSSRTNSKAWGKIASNWHYVSVPADKTYLESEKASKGDIVVAIQAFVEILKGNKLENGAMKTGLNEFFGDIDQVENQPELKQFALRFLLHLVGDLHQPLHTGFKEDRGGNNIKVMWFGEAKKLHGVWDSTLIDSQELSFSELSKKLDILTKKQQQDITDSNLMDWLNESLTLRHDVYNVQKYNYDLSYSYVFDNKPVLDSQLQKAGLRAAKLLNTIFK